MDKFILTEEGARDLIKSIIYSVLLDLCLMLPIGLYIFLLSDFINSFQYQTKITANLLYYLLLIILITAILFVVEWKQYHFMYNTTYTESEKMRINLAEKLRKLPLSFFEKKDLSDLSTMIMNDCADIEHLISHAIPILFGSVIYLCIITAGLVFIEYKLTIALLWVVPASFILIFLSKRSQEKNNEILYTNKRKTSEGIQELIESIKDLKSYNYDKVYLKRLDNTINTMISSKTKTELVTAIGVISSTMILKLGIVSVLLVGAVLILNNQISLITLIIFMICSSLIYTPLENALEFLAEIFSTKPKLNRMRNIKNMEVTGKNENPKIDNYNIEFSNVSFSYDKDREVIKNVSFIAKQSEITALVGPSGGGKSTISKLAAKFWSPTNGKITLDNVNLEDVDSEKLLENYSIVFQDVLLFNNTVFENIKIGNKNASDEEILKAAKIARCDEFVDKLPEGYNTYIGENGILLSGGQRQRISIARAILKDAPIILLDEATSFLDVENESLIQEAISNLIKNKTVIIIAHRMRTVINADKIVFIDNGEKVEEGSPEELLKKESRFKRMVDIQKQSQKWEI